MKEHKREGFSSSLGAFFATLGSAVGLGNIWKFPYLIGSNGGAAFLIVYLLCVIIVGVPIMIAEFYIGRRTRKNIVGAVEDLSGKKGWGTIGVLGVTSSYLVMFFYSAVGGWVYSYVVKSVMGRFKSITKESASEIFAATQRGIFSPIAWQIVVIAVVCLVILFGVQKGIEGLTKKLMPILFILIIICAARAITLPGSAEGLKFLFKPNFSLITPQVILAALGLSFFKLSVGLGTMATYGSYFTDDNNMIKTSFRVAISDTMVSILAGIAIFPAVFSFGMKAEAGPGLLFETIPLVFSQIPFGRVLLIAFFVLTSIAATTAMISMMEVPITYFIEEKNMSRKRAVLINGAIVALVGVLAALSSSEKGILGNVLVFGKSFFNLFDYLSSNLLMPIGGLLIAIFVGYFNSKKDIEKELSNKGSLNNKVIISLFVFIIKYITPILVFIISLQSIGILDWLINNIVK
ncbi:MAG: sodium-dependent transporter [Clostridiales bacterium]|nr:sodium-dependent transporter [Clostridiales bacterium]